jgi:hypothetical protein
MILEGEFGDIFNIVFVNFLNNVPVDFLVKIRKFEVAVVL